MEIESSSSLFKHQKISEKTSPLAPPRPFFPNASDKNFEIAILLKIFHRSYNKNSGVEITPQGPGADVLSYALGAYMVLMDGILV
jgi:hypothetical protein